jgi:hypothetical protein
MPWIGRRAYQLPAGTTDIQTLDDAIAVLKDMLMPKNDSGVTGAFFVQQGALMVSQGVDSNFNAITALTPATFQANLLAAQALAQQALGPTGATGP